LKYAVLAGRQLFSLIFIVASAAHFNAQIRIGALLLIIFLVPVTLVMHNFWSVSDPMTLQIQKAMFMKNLAMFGGALVISYFGADPLSLDALLSQRKELIS
jgi:uncharacterized membrane protein YphA (DoxX/SURF4 family)